MRVSHAAFAAAAVALLTAACHATSPCRPPAALAEANRESPCRPPVAQGPLPAPMPTPPPVAVRPPAPCAPPAPAAVDPEVQARLSTLETTIQRQRELTDALQGALNESEQKRRAAEAVRDVSGSGRVSGESAAAAFAEDLKAKNLRGATVLVEGNRVSVVISDCFESGSDHLKPSPDVKAAIVATAGEIVRHPEATVVVVGHTDSKPLQKTVGKWGDNVGLSRARAETVARALGGTGVPAARLRTDGKGEFEPLVSPEKNAADRARNRRVEITVTF